MGSPTVEISRDDLTLDEVLLVADGAEVGLTEDVVELIGRSRGVVDAAIERGDAIYGVTTGVGHARDHRLPDEALAAAQPFLVEMHLGALGPPLPTSLVRAGMVVRLNGFARGGAGVSMEVVETLKAMLNREIHPVIPRYGSVGSGDLGQLALLGRAMLGRGEVEWEGRKVQAVDALRESGIGPVTLRPKDALGIISSNALTLGMTISEWRSIGRLLDLADLVAATSMEGIAANPSFFDPAVSRVRHSPGQDTTSRNLRAALATSARMDPAIASVQDPISFRVVPQVHGACRDALSGMADELARELNAPADNPMVDVESGRVLSNGNFHFMNVALSIEGMKLALAHVGLLSERRCGQLWDTVVSSMGETVGGEPSQAAPPGGGVPPAFAGLALRYPIAARYTRLRQLAQPVTLDVPSLDLSVEDHATNAAEALWTTHEIAGIITEILAVELLLAYALLSSSADSAKLGIRTGVLVDRVSTQLSSLPPGTLPDETHGLVMEILASAHEILDE